MPAFQPYWGKPAVRNDRGDRGDVGIIRSPVRASILPDHRPLGEHDQLDEAFAWKEERTVSNSLTLQYDQVLFILEPNEVTRPLARQRVTVFDYPDGRLAIKHKGLELPYRTFDKRQRVNQAAVVENKRLGPVLAYIAERQKELDMGRSKKAPSRRGQGPSLFKVG